MADRRAFRPTIALRVLVLLIVAVFMTNRRALRPTIAPLEDRAVPGGPARASATGLIGRATQSTSALTPATGNPFLTADDWMRLHQRNVLAATGRDARVIFLGDSITFFWGDLDRIGVATDLWSRDFAPIGAVNSGIVGDRTQNVLWRVEHGELASRPKAVVLMVGLNNLIWGDTPAQTVAGVGAVLQAIRSQSPGTRVLLLGLLPVAARSPADPLNLAIERVDAELGQFARGGSVTYLNPHDRFLRPDGSIRSALFVADGVHPSAAGYQVLSDAIVEPLNRMLGPATRSR